MSKREMYPTLSNKTHNSDLKLMMNFISLCDGNSSLLQISEILNVAIWDLYKLVDELKIIN